VKPESDILTDLIRNEVPGVFAAYRFGSRETGNAGPESDTDLAVLSDRALPPLLIWDLSGKLTLYCQSEVDLRAASTVMRMQVIAYGRRIYCADSRTCEQFEDFVYSDYARLNEERAAIL